MILRTFDFISRLVWYSVVVLSVLLALYVSLGRYYVPLIGDYRPQIVRQFSEMSGLQFNIDDLRGEWSGFSPAIHIDNFSILSSGENSESLNIPELKVSLDVVASVKYQALHFKSLQLNAAELIFQQNENGRWHLEGLPLKESKKKTSGSPASTDTLVDLLLNISTLEIINTHLKFNFFDGRIAELTALDIKLLNDGDFRRLVISSEAGEDKSVLLAVMEGYGDPRDFDAFTAKAYLKLNDLDLAAFAHLANLNFDLHRLSLDGEFWLDWQNSALSAQGEISSPEINFRRKDGKPIWKTKDFSGKFLVEKNSAGQWQAWIPGLQSAEQVALSATYIKTAKTAEGEVLQLQSEGLSVAPLIKTLLAGDLLNEKLRETLTTLNPAGNLRDVSLTLPLSDTPKEMFQLRAELVNVSASAWKGAPGAKTVNGYLQTGILQGFVDLDSSTLSLDFPYLYDNWLEFDGAQGTVSWRIDKQSIIVESELIKLKAKGDDGFARGQFFLDLPRKPDDYLPHMSLLIGLRDSHARYRQRYIPTLLSADLLQWLEESIDDGELPEVGFIYHGAIKKSEDKPSVQLFADVKKVWLDYHKDWPPVDNADALVLIDNEYTDIQLSRARLYSSDVNDVFIHLEPHASGGLQLDIKGSVSGKLADGLRVIKESPIHDKLGDFIDGWQAAGSMSAKLDLSIPLGADLSREAEIFVDVDLHNGTLALTEENLRFENISGPVVYDYKRGIRSKGLQLDFWQKTARLSISSEAKVSKKTGEKSWRTELNLQGVARVEPLRNWAKQPALDFFSGEAAFNAQLVVDPDEDNFISVASDLKGVTIDLPAPYRKEAVATLNTTYRLPLEGERRLMSLYLGDQLQVQFMNDQERMLGGNISIGSNIVPLDIVSLGADPLETTPFDHRGVLSVTGNVSTFNFSQWLPVLHRYLQVQENWQDSAEGENEELPLVVRGVNIDTFQMFDREIKQLRVDMKYQYDYWRIHLDSVTLRGDVDVFDIDRPYRITLDYLHLDDLLNLDDTGATPELVDVLVENLTDEVSEGAAGEEKIIAAEKKPPVTTELLQKQVRTTTERVTAAEEAALFHPRDIAAADFSVKKLYRQQEDYGRWSFRLRSLPDGLRIEKLLADSKSLHIDGEQTGSGAILEWRQPDSGENNSHFQGYISAKNIGDTLEDWGYEKMMVSESAIFIIDGGWPGDPSEIAVETVSGEMKMLIKKGDFINAPSSASNALKVVGFMNLDKIIRRLQLDFSDLAAEGLSFDQIKGDVKAKSGILKTDKTLTVKGSSSEIRIAGRVDFIEKTIDGQMVVILPLGSNLPWIAAALAGGLPAAASVYVASKVLKKQVDVLSSAVYNISGGWDNPEIRFEKLFDSTPEANDIVRDGAVDNLEGTESAVKPRKNHDALDGLGNVDSLDNSQGPAPGENTAAVKGDEYREVDTSRRHSTGQ